MSCHLTVKFRRRTQYKISSSLECLSIFWNFSYNTFLRQFKTRFLRWIYVVNKTAKNNNVDCTLVSTPLFIFYSSSNFNLFFLLSLLWWGRSSLVQIYYRWKYCLFESLEDCRYNSYIQRKIIQTEMFILYYFCFKTIIFL